MKIVLAADHAGFELKEQIKKCLIGKGFELIDVGAFSSSPSDYPDFAHQLANVIINKEADLGFSFCGSGNGINMVLNKYPEIRSALCWNEEIARLARAHNDANVCALPARFITFETAALITEKFLRTPFDGGRHLIRINKIPIQ